MRMSSWGGCSRLTDSKLVGGRNLVDSSRLSLLILLLLHCQNRDESWGGRQMRRRQDGVGQQMAAQVEDWDGSSPPMAIHSMTDPSVSKGSQGGGGSCKEKKYAPVEHSDCYSLSRNKKKLRWDFQGSANCQVILKNDAEHLIWIWRKSLELPKEMEDNESTG